MITVFQTIQLQDGRVFYRIKSFKAYSNMIMRGLQKRANKLGPWKDLQCSYRLDDPIYQDAIKRGEYDPRPWDARS